MKQYKFIIPSLNTEKILNKLILQFDIFDMKKDEKTCSFFCKSKDKKTIEKILKQYGVKVESKSYYGIFKQLKNASSLGVIIGIVISTILYIISTFFINDVLLIGNLSVTSKEIMEVLDNHNINKWTLKSAVNLESLKNDLQKIKYVSYASVIIKGNAIIINIKEQLTNDEVVNLGVFQPLVAKYDGKITSIKLIQGTLKCKVGDIVKLGDVLVEPYVYDSNGDKLSAQPLADIICDVWITTRLEVKDKEIKKIKTGNIAKDYLITFMGLNLFTQKTDIKFKNFMVEENEKYLTNYILPIKIKYITYSEYKYCEINTEFEKNKDKYLNQTRQMSLLNVKEYDIIKDESYVINKQDDTNIIVYTITVNKLIT